MSRAAILLVVLAGPATAETLRIGASPHYPPYLGTTAGDALYGLDHDLLEAVCARGGYDCRWVDTPVHRLIPALVAGEIDVVAGGIGYSVARDEIVDFTCLYQITADASGAFYARDPEADPAAGVVAVTRQSLHEVAMETADYPRRSYAGITEALEAVLDGEADVFFGSSGVVEAHHRGFELYFIGNHPIPSTGAAFAVSEDRPDLRADLDALMAEISAEGGIAAMQRRWFGSDQGDVIARCHGAAPLS